MPAVKLQLVEKTEKPIAESAQKKPKTRAKKLTSDTANMPHSSEAEAKTAPAKNKAVSPKSKKREACAMDIMQCPAISCHVNHALNEAARLMWEHDLGAIVIVGDHGEPVSMITDRDICMASYTQGRPLYEIAIASAMSKTMVSCQLSTPIAEIRAMMADAQLRRLPVVDEQGKLAGMIGLSDLLEEAHMDLPKDRKRGSSGPMLVQMLHAVMAAAAPE